MADALREEEERREEEEALLQVLAALLLVLPSGPRQVARGRPFSGRAYLEYMVERAGPETFLDQVRMTKEQFQRLCDLLRTRGLEDSPHRYTGLRVEEKVYLFLLCMGGDTLREGGEWQARGTTTTWKVFHEVTEVVLQCYSELVRMEAAHQVYPTIEDDRRFSGYFDACMGALDGSHIPAIVPAADAERFRNRKGWCSKNVLMVVDFRGYVMYCLAGWEGSAHDSRVLTDAYGWGFEVPEGRYLLGDAGYPLTDHVLTPYRGTRYHLSEFRGAARQISTPEELFNHRHSSLQNVVERHFGVVKRKWKILRDMRNFKFDAQVKLVYADCVLHNFLRRCGGDQAPPGEEGPDEEEAGDTDPPSSVQPPARTTAVVQQRDLLAQRMFQDYQRRVRVRPRREEGSPPSGSRARTE